MALYKCIIIITIIIIIIITRSLTGNPGVLGFHCRRLQRTRHYSVLHSRYHDNAADMVTNLLEESDGDDDALIDPTSLEPHHRLALSDRNDDDDLLCKHPIESYQKVNITATKVRETQQGRLTIC